MKVFSSAYGLDYSWDEVSTAQWQKYRPDWNTESTHVTGVDTLSRRVDSATGILRTERLITCRQPAPKWLKTFLGSAETSHVYEVSYVKPSTPIAATAPASATHPPHVRDDEANHPVASTPSVTMTSYNLTWCDLITVRETVLYMPCPHDPTRKTRFEQEAKITAMCGGWQKVKEKIEGMTAERFGQNAAKGRMGFEEVLAASRRAFGEEKERERERSLRGRGQQEGRLCHQR